MSVVRVESVSTKFGVNLIHDKVSFQINQGDIYGILGGSGSGKSTIMREILMLEQLQSGNITVLDKSIKNISINDSFTLKKNWGVLFQFGALFSSLSVLQNISVLLKEYTDLPDSLIEEIAFTKLKMVGLPDKAAHLYPSELSGGMKKRVGLARSLAMDPKLLFLDEPTSGLDPNSAESFDRLIVELRDMLNLTVVMVTHDLATIENALDRFVVFYDKKVLFEGSYEEAKSFDHFAIKKFLKI
ncbi:MAG: ATP-binding cassette domain-containing protein [Campylobacterota bacterium]|nr:ATP-binding cassette domain-containing protein [Campylobacterota bacterium]